MSSTEHWTTIALIAVAIVATVPLGRRVCATPTRRIDWIAAALALTALLLPPGVAAATLAAPWLMVASRATVRSVVVIVRARRLVPVTIGMVLANGWWANAGVWLVAHRAGIEPLGFDRTITLLTVGHFHHAGFGLTALFVAAHERLPHRRVVLVAGGVHQIGMLLVAAGLTFSDHLEVVGAATITGALGGWAWLVGRMIRSRHGDSTARWLLATSAVAWVVPMALAVAWALGPFLTEPVVRTFQTMLEFHAAINALGLVLGGLVGLDRIPVRDAPAPPPTPSRSENSRVQHPATHS